jgi:hypothetical protein
MDAGEALLWLIAVVVIIVLIAWVIDAYVRFVEQQKKKVRLTNRPNPRRSINVGSERFEIGDDGKARRVSGYGEWFRQLTGSAERIT